MAKYSQRSNGLWQTSVSVNGKKKYIYARTKRELDEKVLQLKIEVNQGLDLTSRQLSFEEWTNSWLKIKKTSVQPNTFENMQYPVKHLLDRFADVPISKIKNLDIQDLIQDLALQNPYTGKPTAVDTLKKIKSCAKQIFDLAVQNQAIVFNPVNGVTIPTFTPPQQRRALTKEEQQWIVDTPHRAQIAAMIMMFAGLRRGELIALTWNDIDLKNKIITVNKSVYFEKNKAILKPQTKTKAGMRKVTITNPLVDFLANSPKESIYVTCTAQGGIHTKTSWRRMWDSYMLLLNHKYGDFTGYNRKKNDKLPMVIPPITPHWLRHTYATLLYFAGVDILTAVEMLGHADSKTTMDIYTHLNRQFKDTQMDKLEEYLGEQNL